MSTIYVYMSHIIVIDSLNNNIYQNISMTYTLVCIIISLYNEI